MMEVLNMGLIFMRRYKWGGGGQRKTYSGVNVDVLATPIRTISIQFTIAPRYTLPVALNK